MDRPSYYSHPLYYETAAERILVSELKVQLLREMDRLGPKRVGELLHLVPLGVERVRAQSWDLTTAMRIALALGMTVKLEKRSV
jgi:hypothetical protein